MNSHELHTRGLLDARTAILAALIADGWGQDEAEDVLATHVATARAVDPVVNWQRWTPDELAVLDEAIDAADGRLPRAAATRPIAERLGRTHKAVLGAIERRIAARQTAADG